MGLASIIAIAMGVTIFMLVFIVPVLGAIHDHMGHGFAGFVATMIGTAEIVWNSGWLWLPLLFGGLALFEWKCKSDN